MPYRRSKYTIIPSMVINVATCFVRCYISYSFLQVNLKSSVTEKNLMKGTEQRLMQENKTLIEQQRSQNVLLTNLQTIQVYHIMLYDLSYFICYIYYAILLYEIFYY